MRLRVLASFIGFVLMFTGAAHAQSIFVDKNSTASYEDGSARAPFRTITSGLDLARKIRLGSSEEGIKPSPATINVHVAPSLTRTWAVLTRRSSTPLARPTTRAKKGFRCFSIFRGSISAVEQLLPKVRMVCRQPSFRERKRPSAQIGRKPKNSTW